MRCQLVFTTWESKAFLAKTIMSHPLVKKNLESGVIAIGRGTTNAIILREMLMVTGNSDFEVDINNYVAGIIDSRLWGSNSETRTPEVAFYDGKPKFEPISESIDNADLVIKGANVIGTDWVAGVLCGHPAAGTMGNFYDKAIVQGKKILVAASIEKMIPYPLIHMMGDLGGQNNIDYVRGSPVGLFPIVGGEIFTEIEAFQTFSEDLDVYPIGVGGIYKGAGATVFEIAGDENKIKEVIQAYEEIRDAPALEINLKAD
ncbi:MAG: hypothetical protein ACXAD7_12240 [Candidatus Kariarchaeaceae archaeon]|jgi:hypothetical protein